MRKGTGIPVLVFIAVSLMATSVRVMGQSKAQKMYKLATEQLDTILDGSDKLRDFRKFIGVRSKAANLLWTRDSEQSRIIFRKLWQKVDQESDEDRTIDKEGARIDILEQLFPRDAVLAHKLIALSRNSKTKGDSLLETLNGTNQDTRRLAFLAYRLAEENPVLAGRVLGDSLSENTTPTIGLVLLRIRDNNPALANYIAAQALERFPSQSPSIGLCGLVNTASYLFPMASATLVSTETVDSDENLRQQFTLIGYDVLKRSLLETDDFLIGNQHFTNQALVLRKFNQAAVAGMLLALSPRYSTEYFVELALLTSTLMKGLPSQLVDLVSLQIAAVKAALGMDEKSEVSDAEIMAAIAREDFFTAESLIGEIKDEARRSAWLDLMLRSQAKTQLKRGELLLALGTTRKIEDRLMSVPILIETAKVASKRNDEALSISVFQEIQSQTKPLNQGIQAKIMFSVSSETAYFMKTQALLALEKSVETINGLSEIKKAQTRQITYRGENYWEDPDNFLSSEAMTKAFSTLGEIELEETLLIADKFHDNSLQMIARLASIERILKKGQPKVEPEKPSTKTKKKS